MCIVFAGLCEAKRCNNSEEGGCCKDNGVRQMHVQSAMTLCSIIDEKCPGFIWAMVDMRQGTLEHVMKLIGDIMPIAFLQDMVLSFTSNCTQPAKHDLKNASSIKAFC